MNKNLGLIGKKLGNTQIFDADGMVHRVTAIECGPCIVVGKRLQERDGYTALVIGWGEKREKSVTKPEAGLFKKIGQKAAQEVQEFRLPAELVAKYEVGQAIKPSEIFAEGQLVDVCGTSKGRGFTGVMKRHNFKGSRTQSHGTHEYQRHGEAHDVEFDTQVRASETRRFTMTRTRWATAERESVVRGRQPAWGRLPRTTKKRRRSRRSTRQRRRASGPTTPRPCPRH